MRQKYKTFILLSFLLGTAFVQKTYATSQCIYQSNNEQANSQEMKEYCTKDCGKDGGESTCNTPVSRASCDMYEKFKYTCACTCNSSSEEQKRHTAPQRFMRRESFRR